MAPTITIISPTLGTAIDTDTPIVVDVTSAPGFSALLLFVFFPGYGVTELVHDGTSYTTPYRPFSTRTAITNGFEFSFRRSPLWPDSPALQVFAVDTAGGASSGSAAWVLPGAPAASSVPATAPVFPVGAGPGGCPAPLHDQAYMLEVLKRFFPAEYTDGLKAGDGYELHEAFAKLGERLSLADERFECGVFFLSATGGSFSTGSVEFYRDDDSAGGYILKAGTTITTSATSRDFVTTEDATFGPTDLGPFVVPVQAVWQGWEWNTRGQVITLRGEVITGEIDTVKLPITITSTSDSTPVIDPALRVRQITDMSGGAAPMLDALGEDRGLPRRAGEQDDSYRLRLRTLPDTVSPGAIQRLILAFLSPYNATAEFIELWDIRFQTCWNAPLVLDNPNYDPTTFVYNDPRPPPPHADPQFRGRWLDSVIQAGAFVVVMPRLQPIMEFGMAYNDPAITAADLRSTDFPNGQRAASAYNIPPSYDGMLTGAYNGIDTGFVSLTAAMYQTLQQIKAAGVAAIVEIEGA